MHRGALASQKSQSHLGCPMTVILLLGIPRKMYSLVVAGSRLFQPISGPGPAQFRAECLVYGRLSAARQPSFPQATPSTRSVINRDLGDTESFAENHPINQANCAEDVVRAEQFVDLID